MRRRPSVVLAWLALVVLAGPALAQDVDRDGLPDVLEQALLERFAPTLVLSAGECDGLPARFVPDLVHPKVAGRDGTLYGHVSRLRTPPGAPVEVELKYFHLWSRDCGRPRHGLDIEHVSALVSAPALDAPDDRWEARQWYAAAHEGTVCDASSGAQASALRARRGGPYVYVSRGKHASYLVRGHCKWGCGGDLCDPGPPLVRRGIVNIGERDAPMQGAAWVTSRRWDLADKLGSDFEPARRARIDRARPLEVLALELSLRAWQAPILGGDTGLDSLIVAGRSAGRALGATAGATATTVEATAGAVGTALDRTARGVARFLGFR